MKVHQKSVVRLEYELHIGGQRLEHKSKTILLGHAFGLPPGLEASLLGHEAGEAFSVSVENGYGVVDPTKRQHVSRQAFPKDMQLELGQSFYSKDRQGSPVSVRIVTLENDTVTVDANHPHAGKTLEYTIKIHSVREAEQEELEHGHVHGEGGVAHHH